MIASDANRSGECWRVVAHLLAAEGAEAIEAGTDTTNTPMAAAFTRAGYPVSGEQVVLT